MTKIAPLLFVAACAVDPSGGAQCHDGKCDGGNGDVDQTCTDKHYGDGTCDLDLACAVPDIDCFHTFASDADAATWWSATERSALNESFPIIPESDPRYARVRASLDAGWEAFKINRPVGELADQRPALVIVDQPINHAAFVYADDGTGHQPFAVMVETGGLAAGADDDALLGVMMHELQHAVGLHNMADRASRIRKYYSAMLGKEPMGREQTDDPDLRYLGEAWIDAASNVGPYSQVELGGLPLSGDLQMLLGAAVQSGLQSHAAQCQPIVDRIDQITSTVTGAADPLDGSLPDLTGVDDAVFQVLYDLANDCLADFPYGVIEVGASVAGITPAEFEAKLSASDLALVKGVPFVDGLMALVEDRRANMRATEELFTEGTNQPWTQFRYFSNEEDADDVSAIVMHAAGKDPLSITGFFHAVMPAATRTACDAKLASGFPGYGVDLTDSHHSVCWRIGHVQRETKTFRARVSAQPPIPHTVRQVGKWPQKPNPHALILD